MENPKLKERQHQDLVKALNKIAQALFAISDSLDRVADATAEVSA